MFRTQITFGECDPNAHLNTAHYTTLFDRATWLYFEHLGVGDTYGALATIGWADVRVTVEYKREVRIGDWVRLLSSLGRVGTKSITLRHEMRLVSNDVVCATYESITVRFDLVRRVAIPVPELFRKADVGPAIAE
jgi:acyl-CoA thioester hydrolase